MKRKASSSVEHDDIEDENSAKVRKTEFKKEYTKLRKLVPALNARDDITKVLQIARLTHIRMRVMLKVIDVKLAHRYML